MFPEEGRNAIAAAARAIADLRLGRIDDESSANVGVIEGGTARNIVAERCTFVAEVRCHEERKLTELVQEVLDAISFAASMSDCNVDVQQQRSYRGYRFKRDDEVVRLAADALTSTGHEPRYGLSGGAADANVRGASMRTSARSVSGSSPTTLASNRRSSTVVTRTRAAPPTT